MALRSLGRRQTLLAGGVVLLPLAFLGYGTDIDVANVLRAGTTWLEEGRYAPSRPPGAPVHELGTAVLDRLGGSVAVVLASIALAVVAVWALVALVEEGHRRWAALAGAALFANPWFLVAATSLNDAVWALASVLCGCVAARRDRRVLAGLAFGLAVGCRSSLVLVAAAWLVAERLGAPSTRPSRGASAQTAAVLGAVGLLCLLPPWWAAGRSVSFLDVDIEFVGWAAHVGRWAVKNVAAATVPGALVLLAGGRALLRTVRERWRTDVVVRFAVLSIVAGEVLFLRLPLKPVHLLPVVAAACLLAGAAGRRWLLVGLIAAQALGGVAGVTVAGPDVAHRAETGSLDVRLTAGVLVHDLRCRWRDRELGPWPDPGSRRALERAFANFDCQNGAWRAPADRSGGGPPVEPGPVGP